MRSVISTIEVDEDQRPATTTGGMTHRSCPCGQQLDVCARAHCPRCGRTLR